jgi:hypothetical protein
MSPIRFTGNPLAAGSARVEVALSLLAFRDETGAYLLYCPGLDLYGSGNTAAQARASFKEALEEYLRYTLSKSTLDDELRRLGWRVAGRGSSRTYTEPPLTRLARTNEDLQQILNLREYSKYHQAVELPMAA